LYEDEVLGADARSAEYLDPAGLRSIYAAHRSRRSDEGVRLWALLALERWLRRCASADPLEAPPAPLVAS
jgi:hypothetical protein